MLICNARLFDGNAFVPGAVRLSGGKILEAGDIPGPLSGEKVLALEGQALLPGFVDVHIHAFRGRDTMQGEAAVRAMSREVLVKNGEARLRDAPWPARC